MCQFHPIHIFIHHCHILIVPFDYLVYFCQSLHLGSRSLQTRGSWSAHGLPCVFLFRSQLSHRALVFVCLMQLSPPPPTFYVSLELNTKTTLTPSPNRCPLNKTIPNPTSSSVRQGSPTTHIGQKMQAPSCPDHTELSVRFQL